MRYLLLIIAVFFLVGCSVRTYTVEKERVDTQLEGNRGYLSGNPPASAKKENRLGDTRKMSVMEVEFGSYSRKKKSGKNRVKKEYVRRKRKPQYPSSSERDMDMSYMRGAEEETYPDRSATTGKYKWYTIQKNDTLQKISQKFYNTTKKWLTIFEYNKDILKSPDKIYPGKKIKIPELK